MSSRKKQKANIFGSLLVGFLMVLGLYLFFGNTKTKASWFDDAWRYRVAVPISAHTTAETNVYITLSGSDGINTTDTTKFQTDCGDIRFVNEAGDLLPYYLTTACGLAQTGFQVYFESFPAGAQTIYYYYGNPSTPNGFSGASMGAAATGVTLGTRGSESEAPSSPMVYFRLDEGVGQTIANSMETVNNGTLGPDATVTATDPTWRSEELCMVGKCLEFESTSSQYVNVANTIGSVNSVSFWVKPTSTTTPLMVLNGATGNASISVSSGTISAGAGFTSPTIYVNGVVKSTLVANEWQYVTVTTATGISASNIMIGRVNTGYLDGFIDEVKLFGSALSVSQIKAGYASGLARSSSVKNSSASFGGGSAAGTLANGLVGYWKMDEDTGSSAYDSSGNGNTMTLTGMSSDWTMGKFGSALLFSGAGHEAKSTQTYGTTTEGTIEAWIYPTTISGAERTIFAAGDDSTADRFLHFLVDSAGRLVLYIRENTTSNELNYQTASGIITVNNWYHVVVTQSSATPKFYVNGVLVAISDGNQVGTADGTEFFDDLTGIDNTTIGYRDRVSNDGYFIGTIDEVRVYNRVLSSVEIVRRYNFSPGPVGYWKFDEGAGSTNYDYSGNENNLTLTNSPKWSTGKVGGALEFDGSGAVSANFSVSSDLVIADDVTLEAWIFQETTATDQVIIRADGGSTGEPDNENYRLYVNDTDSTLKFQWQYGASNLLQEAVSTVGLSGHVGRWVHVAATRNTVTNIVIFYQNGVQLGNTVSFTNDPTGGGGSTPDLYIGARDSSSGDPFDGKIDEVKIFNYVRSQDQILADINFGKVFPVAHWKFDEGSGTVANDSSVIGSNESLTLSSATSAWTNTAKFGKAFSSGGTRRLSRADDANLDFTATEDFAIGFWMKSSIASAGNPSATEYIVYKAPSGATNGGYGVYANTSGQICVGIDDDNTSFPEDSSCASVDVYDNTWHYVMAVKRGTSKLEVYIDTFLSGTPDTTISSTANTLANTSTFYVGSANAVDDTDDFNGDIDELQIIRGGLSAEQIRVLANTVFSSLGAVTTSSTGVPDRSDTGRYCVPGDDATCSAPLLHWKFDENSGTSTTYDSSGNGRDGTLNNIGNSDWVVGKYGSGLNLENANDSVSIADNDVFSVNNTNQLTVEAWVKLDSTNLTQEIVNKGSGSNYEWAIRVNSDGAVYAYLYQAGGGDYMVTPFSSTLVANNWYHIAMVANTSTPSLKLFLNGVLIAEDTTTAGSYTNGTAAVRVGERADGNRDVDGVVDEVKIYGYARTGSQIAWDYNQGAPVGHWKFDECQGATLFDSANTANTAAITIGASGAQSAVGTCATSATTARYTGREGKINSALNFDGTDDYAVRTGSKLPTTDFTYTAWVNRSATNNSSTILKISPGDGTNELKFAITSSGSTNVNKLRFTTNGDSIYSETALPLTDTWYHVAITRSGTTRKMYINGNLDSVYSNVDGVALSFGSCNLFIGGSPGSGCAATLTEYFTGKIDDLRIYNYALNKSQIQSVMNSGALMIGPSAGLPN